MQSKLLYLVLTVFSIALLIFVSSGLKRVIAAAKEARFIEYDNGVVFDSQTGYEWYIGPDKSTSWEEAVSWVAKLDANGGGWRMPTKKTLRTLYHVGDGIRNIASVFITTGYWIWSLEKNGSSSMWVFNFSYGGEGWNGQPPSTGGRAFAVRNQK